MVKERDDMRRICVNCGSSPGFDPVYMKMAAGLGRSLAEREIELVYGGAEVGLMGGVADAVLAAGGAVIGVIPQHLATRVSHRELTRLHVVDTMHERKALMFDLADAVIALPGGFGTLEEIAELLTWAQLGLHAKPCGLLNVDGYFDLLLAYLDQAVTKGFMKPQHRDMLLVAEDPEELLRLFRAYRAPRVDKWVGALPSEVSR